MRIVLAAGGTGGHIFPALSVALALRRQAGNVSLLWIGTARSREQEICAKNRIEIELVQVSGISRGLNLSAVTGLLRFVVGTIHMWRLLGRQRPDAVVAFGGYVCAPVLAAARLRSVPYFIQEQNSAPGLTNLLFSRGASRAFLGFPPSGKRRLHGRTIVTGTPVRRVLESLGSHKYPEGFDTHSDTILICGGSQGAASMNQHLLEPVKKFLASGRQVVWQTGTRSYEEIRGELNGAKGAFIFDSLEDLYPYYAVAKVVVGRSGASTLGEVAGFGLPIVTIPLPWSAGDHQWLNAGVVEEQGRGVRVRQDDKCGERVWQEVEALLRDNSRYEKMCGCALDRSADDAADIIAREIVSETNV